LASASYSQKPDGLRPANENFCGGFTGEKVPLSPASFGSEQARGYRLSPRPAPLTLANCRRGTRPPAEGLAHNSPVAAVRFGDRDCGGPRSCRGTMTDVPRLPCQDGELLWSKNNSGSCHAIAYEVDARSISPSSRAGVWTRTHQDALWTRFGWRATLPQAASFGCSPSRSDARRSGAWPLRERPGAAAHRRRASGCSGIHEPSMPRRGFPRRAFLQTDEFRRGLDLVGSGWAGRLRSRP